MSPYEKKIHIKMSISFISVVATNSVPRLHDTFFGQVPCLIFFKMNQNKMNLRDFAGIYTLNEEKSLSEVMLFLTISIFLNLVYITKLSRFPAFQLMYYCCLAISRCPFEFKYKELDALKRGHINKPQNLTMMFYGRVWNQEESAPFRKTDRFFHKSCVKTVYLRENARCTTIETNGNEKIREIHGQKEGEEHSCARKLVRVYHVTEMEGISALRKQLNDPGQNQGKARIGEKISSCGNTFGWKITILNSSKTSMQLT